MPIPLPRRLIIALVALGLAVAVAGCGGDDNGGTGADGSSPTTAGGGGPTTTGKGEATDKVPIKDFEFVPKVANVKVGATVTWTNEDSFDHSVIADDKSFASEKFKGEPFSHKFDKAGSFSYICGVHNYMTGTIVVS